MYVVDLVLFFLDTFLWYIIWNTVFSIGRSFFVGLSIWKLWKDIYAQSTKKIYAKLLATKDMEVKYKPKVGFHSFIFTFVETYRFNPGARLPNLECHSSSLCTVNISSPSNTSRSSSTNDHQVDTGASGHRSSSVLQSFMAQADKKFDVEFFPPGSEAERRISFFAQSLTTEIAQPIYVDAMPTFTVLTPRYGEKVSCGALFLTQIY